MDVRIFPLRRFGAAVFALWLAAPLAHAQTIYLADAEVREQSLVAQVHAQQAALLNSLQQLQDAYCRAAQLDEALAVREQLRALQRSMSAPLPAVTQEARVRPGQSDGGFKYHLPSEVSSRVGETFYARVTGVSTGSVWGSGLYTSDSSLAAAAVHAGVLKVGETKVVRYRIAPGQSAYTGSSNHGVETTSYGPYPSSFQIFEAAPASDEVQLPSLRGQAVDSITLFVIAEGTTSQSGSRGLIHHVSGQEASIWDGGMMPYALLDLIPADRREPFITTTRTIWGGKNGIYTDDSPVSLTVVHAGLLKPGEAGMVTVELLAGQSSYEGSNQNQIQSQNYGEWPGSYRLRHVHPEPDRPKGAANNRL